MAPSPTPRKMGGSEVIQAPFPLPTQERNVLVSPRLKCPIGGRLKGGFHCTFSDAPLGPQRHLAGGQSLGIPLFLPLCDPTKRRI
jgi:hypothetical protein